MTTPFTSGHCMLLGLEHSERQSAVRCTEMVTCSDATIVSSLPVLPVGDSIQLKLN